MAYTNYTQVKKVMVINNKATVVFIDNVTKCYNLSELPKYILKFMDTRVCESDNIDNCKVYEKPKERKEYNMSKRQPDRYQLYGEVQHRPDGKRFTANEIDIITVCSFRINTIKNACKNCCYKDATYENTHTNKGLYKHSGVCYGCNDFLKKYNAYPDAFMCAFKKGEM